LVPASLYTNLAVKTRMLNSGIRQGFCLRISYSHFSLSSVNRSLSLIFLGGKIYALGGHSGTTRMNSAERYSPHLNQWQMIPSVHCVWSNASTASLNGKVSIFLTSTYSLEISQKVCHSRNTFYFYLWAIQFKFWLGNQDKSFCCFHNLWLNIEYVPSNSTYPCRIWGSHSGGYEDFYFLR
jgi:hypothetical protein